ncbi:hypothetical protein [Leptospira bandrabouensis]|uniref:hypothetical protein n=1 Tax=Leptospira bandrabouensis TaxID=2484903 RepID=UPI001EE9E674|nr:hypothetical protein [Leptospira bandrabouensis]MCG6146069.1 hypothetical protein [Leptospira bandrabouensis]MCG6165656.1 hypothetical protein [Leptospira bandrabouensis]
MLSNFNKAIFLGITLYAILLFAFSGIPDADIFYHFAVTKLYLKEGLVSKLPWPEIGIQSREFTDYHFLFHLTMIPFLFLPTEETIKIKLFILFSISLLLYQLTSYFRKEAPSLSPYFIVIFFILGSVLFTGRMLFGRGNLLFFSLYLLSLRIWDLKYNKWIFLLSFLATWSYSGFPFLFFTGLFIVILERSSANTRLFFSSSMGMFTGLVIHPSFPYQFKGYFIELIIQSFPPPGVEAIAEWLPPTRDILILGFLPILPLLLLSFSNKTHYNFHPRSFVFLFLGIVCLIFTGASLRVFEISWLMFYIFIFLNTTLSKKNQILTALILFVIQFPIAYEKMNQQFRSSETKYGYIVTQWIKFNIPQGERIFLSWADYPYFTFKLPEYRYLFGLNPLYAWSFSEDQYFSQKAFFEGIIPGFQQIPKILNYETVVINKFYYNFAYSEFKKVSSEYHLVFENEKYGIFVKNTPLNKNTKEIIIPQR